MAAQAADGGGGRSVGVVAMEGPRTRVLVTLEARTAGGVPRPVRALVDTGGGAMVIRRQLAEELDLALGATIGTGEGDLETVEPPQLRANGFELDTDGLAAYVVDDGDHGNPLRAEGADVNLPASLLRRHRLVLDAPASLVTFGDPRSVEERGVRLPVGVHPGTGFVRTEITVDGRTHGVLLDSGPSCSLVVDHLYRTWQADHPDWPAAAASVGPANMAGIPAEARLPMLRVATMD
ncbi:MAG: retropepsin-like domain-containing protein, partial [Actinomycetota bacterium]|nr:retropepsin-like domain-containing protein [Actinomycetota bacterium]